MSNKMIESVSAAMDNEAGAFELRRVMDEAGRNPQLRDIWMRYHLIGAVLRGEWQAGGFELHERVCNAPHQRRTGVAVRRRRLRDAWKHWRGQAVAASLVVAAIMAVVLSMNLSGVQVGEPGGQTAARPVFDEFGSRTLEGGLSQAEYERLNAYMMRHIQQRAIRQPGVSSLTKIVTYTAADTPWQ